MSAEDPSEFAAAPQIEIQERAETDQETPDLASSALAALRSGARNRPARPSRRSRRGSGPGEPVLSGARPDDRDPQPLSRAVSAWLRAGNHEQTARLASVMSCWDRIVGPEVASHCAPQSLRDGELVLQAESTAWATQLRFLAPRLLARIDAEVGAGTVRRIRVHGPTAPSWVRGLRRVPGPGPRDTYG